MVISELHFCDLCLPIGVAGAGLATVFPNSIGRGAAFDAELEMRMAQAVAMEARAKHTDAVKVVSSPKFD